MADRPGGDLSSSKTGCGWPAPRSGVAPGFRNFCITNEHPDGIVFEPSNGTGGKGTPTPSTNATNSADETTDQAEVTQPTRRLSSSSSSIMSCSPCASPVFSSLPSSPCSSTKAASDAGTIIISSSSSDMEHDRDDQPISEDVSREKVNEKDKSERNGTNGLINSNGNNAETLEVKVAASPVPSTSASSQVASACAKNDGPVVEPLLGTSTPPLLYHKKFHYKTRTATAPTKEANNTASGVKKQLESSKDSPEPCHEKSNKPPDVNDLKLSPYISREQAALRLRALGSLEATQREIENFAAIISSGAMFRMQLNNGNNAAAHNKTSSGASSQKAQQHHLASGEKNIGQKNAYGAVQVASASSSMQVGRPPTGQTFFVSSTASVSLGSGGDVISTQPSSSSSVGINDSDGDEDDRMQTVERKRTVGGSGGYFMVTSPGQASTSDDYEWISD